MPLANPLSAELGVMRTALLPGLVAALARNAARQQPRVRLFELGNVFAANGGDAPLETQRIAAVACGDAAAEQWGGAGARGRLPRPQGRPRQPGRACPARTLEYRAVAAGLGGHPGRSADVFRLTATARRASAGSASCTRACNGAGPGRRRGRLRAGPRRRCWRAPLPRAAGLSKFPSVRRDLAFVVAGNGALGRRLRPPSKAAAGASLRDLVLFDRYAGKGVETGFKSLAMGLILQDESRTLTDRDVDAVVAEVVAALQREHGAAIRS